MVTFPSIGYHISEKELIKEKLVFLILDASALQPAVVAENEVESLKLRRGVRSDVQLRRDPISKVLSKWYKWY